MILALIQTPYQIRIDGLNGTQGVTPNARPSLLLLYVHCQSRYAILFFYIYQLHSSNSRGLHVTSQSTNVQRRSAKLLRDCWALKEINDSMRMRIRHRVTPNNIPSRPDRYNCIAQFMFRSRIFRSKMYKLMILSCHDVQTNKQN